MPRWKKPLVVAVVSIGGLIFVPMVALAAIQAVSNLYRVDARVLESEIRHDLPPGSSRSQVEEVLGKHRLEHSFSPDCGMESSHTNPESITACGTEFAIARNVRGSSWLIESSIAFEFHFDREMKLESIDSKMKYTGP
jgi:hypothetical protein